MIRVLSIAALAALACWLLLQPALAVQEHGAPEGIISHQGAHLFFIASMMLLVYWLRQRRLVREAGWRYIQYAAFFSSCGTWMHLRPISWMSSRRSWTRRWRRPVK